ncbi:hypothetical protein SAY87_002386 [Trapa incisa]|uniref:DNA/RNA-binding protein Alba-like domain-containing protein n=1 Tax=Trapa incisa TaxID=236973 RepID=A0AAN7JVP5_9MYRT|nr:hypothetical protein SAY87_002386 [Trapa incisa]
MGSAQLTVSFSEAPENHIKDRTRWHPKSDNVANWFGDISVFHNSDPFVCYSAAIATAVTVAEILKNNGLAVEKKIMTSTVDIKDDSRGRLVQKAKIEIVLGKTANFDELMDSAAEERENNEGDEQR